ncbi:hypothetical protein M422DRAFT_240868 [Sphaerobolus stellatus SS14]|nr:hypothetical protein M422DRAFT_240868 [Sphaerobolus stellatus SS14]
MAGLRQDTQLVGCTAIIFASTHLNGEALSNMQWECGLYVPHPEIKWGENTAKALCIMSLIVSAYASSLFLISLLANWLHQYTKLEFRESPSIISPDTLLSEILRCCNESKTRYVAIYDGADIILLDRTYIEVGESSSIINFICKPREPLALWVAFLILRDAARCRFLLCSRLYLKTSYIGKGWQFSTNMRCNGIDGFSICFTNGKHRNPKDVLANPVEGGHVLKVEANSFEREVVQIRSSVRFLLIPTETRDSIIPARLREKDWPAQEIISSTAGIFSLHVTAQIRRGKDNFSQVIEGYVTDGYGLQSATSCVKLYDERLFKDMPYRPQDFDVEEYGEKYQKSSPERVVSWVTAEDLARREESIYNRLKEYQGSLLSHSYGFHHLARRP